MKKFLVFAAAALLIMGLAGQANALFAPGDLVRVEYDSVSNVEIATDLGNVSTLSGTINIAAPTLTDLGDTSMNNVNVAYFTYTGAKPNTTFYAAVNATGVGPAQFLSGSNSSTINNVITGMLSLYAGGSTVGDLANSTKITNISNLSNSYFNAFNGLATDPTQGAGAFSGSLDTTTANFSEVNAGNGKGNLFTGLGGLGGAYPGGIGGASTGTEQLYMFKDPGGGVEYGSLVSGWTIITGAGGSTEIIAPSGGAAPIPPSILLMGSGLLGLIGVGRRKFFA
jgi:hypothetical protein